MAIDYGSHSDKQRVKQLIKSNHRVDVILMLMDLSHNHISEHSDRLLAGQVNIDTTADITRNASFDLRDPLHKLKLDDHAPADGSIFFTKMFRIIFVFSPPDNSEHYPIPIFTGPVTGATRNGPVLTVECQGKEVLAMGPVWGAKTLKEGIKKVSAILKVMGWAGENKFHFIDKDARLGDPISAKREKKFSFWILSRKIASGMNLQLFYDGRGILQLRRKPAKSVYEFGDDVLMSEPQVQYALNDEFCNVIIVIGGKPKGRKKKIKYRLVAPRSHPLSPKNLGRNGTSRHIPRVIEDDTIKSKKAAKALAKRELSHALLESVQVSFDSLPVPFLEELDMCRFRSDTSAGQFRLQQMSIPLTVDGVSTIGYTRNVTPRHRGRRRHHKRRHRHGNR
jgi:hypothetical protein